MVIVDLVSSRDPYLLFSNYVEPKASYQVNVDKDKENQPYDSEESLRIRSHV